MRVSDTRRFPKNLWFVMAAVIIAVALLQPKPQLCADQQQGTKDPVIVYDKPVTDPTAYIEVVSQYPDYPSGDEFAAAACFLRAYGYNADIQDLIGYMNYSDTFDDMTFFGDAKTDTGCCSSSALTIAIDNYLSNKGGKMWVRNRSGIDFDALSSYISSGKPAIVWYTSDGKDPNFISGSERMQYPLYENSKTAVAYGIADGSILLTDSTTGMVSRISLDEFESIWEECGSQCVIAYDQ